MAVRKHCCLRKHRRTWGLTQAELATLVGCKSPNHISRIERGERAPKMEVALACEVLFGVSPWEMFPNLHGQLEDRVMRRVYALYLKLKVNERPTVLRKREFLEQALKRATRR